MGWARIEERTVSLRRSTEGSVRRSPRIALSRVLRFRPAWRKRSSPAESCHPRLRALNGGKAR